MEDSTQLSDPLPESAENVGEVSEQATPDEKRVKLSNEEKEGVAVVFFVLGRRRTNGWPYMSCVYNPKSSEEFELAIAARLQGPVEKDVLRSELAYFVVGRLSPGRLHNLNFLNDANVRVPDGCVECENYDELKGVMKWSQ